MYYQKNGDEVCSELNVVQKSGLTQEEAKKRLEKYGPNKLKEAEKESFLSKLLNQFKDVLVLILIVAAVLSFIVGERVDAVVIIAILVVNAFLGLYQEGRAEKSLEALQKMSAPTAKVIRDGNQIEIASDSVVPGDIVVLETGDIIPADLRLIESSNLKIDESSLTGESVPAEKDAKITFDEEVSLGDRINLAFSGSIVSYGRGKGVVTGTGHETEIGKIATMIQSYDNEQTPLQKKLNQLGKVLGIIVLVVCGLVFALGALQGRDLLTMFMTAISLAVAAVPEGLTAIVTIVLAIGMNRMVERNAIVKKLLSVETLGTVTYICSDKTGTLTQNEMTVVKAFTGNKLIDVSGTGYEPKGTIKVDGKEAANPTESADINTLMSIGILCSDAKLTKQADQYKILGDPTEGALVTFAGKAGITSEDINKKYPRIEELPFDSDRKLMTTFHENFIPGKVVSFTKGAPDILIGKSKSIYIDGQIVPFTDELKKKVLDVNSSFAKEALRVLSMAFRQYDSLPSEITSETVENDLIFVGLMGMIDPPREEAKEAITKCKHAGIHTVMITGDYKDTAFAIAKQLGMAETEDQAIMGHDLDKYSDEELKEVVKQKRVYARVSPEHKVKIVTALKANGEIVAMTGDGVNDALAIKKADIGISMGITGTDVAKSTADVILTDDNFASIVAAVEEGRIIYSNIKKFVSFLLSCNVGEVLIVFLAILFNWDVPLVAIQLLWLNLVTDSFPALALGVEKGDPEIMDVPPRNPSEPILDKEMVRSLIVQSIAIATGSLLAYRWGLKTYGDLTMARTLTFVTLITAELLRAYTSRSLTHSVFKIGFFSNKSMNKAVALGFILTLIVIYVPFLEPVFNTFALGLKDWGMVLLFALIPFTAGELYKLIVYRHL